MVNISYFNGRKFHLPSGPSVNFYKIKNLAGFQPIGFKPAASGLFIYFVSSDIDKIDCIGLRKNK